MRLSKSGDVRVAQCDVWSPNVLVRYSNVLDAAVEAWIPGEQAVKPFHHYLGVGG